jgi:hypothetical protein
MTIKPFSIFTLILIAVTFFGQSHPHAADLGDLSPVISWDKIARGVWRAEMGIWRMRYAIQISQPAPQTRSIECTLRHSISILHQTPLLFFADSNQKVMVRIPTDEGETLYGFGLQLDGIKHSRKVMTLNVDHWSKGGGRTHAPVPFYISSKGYGVFFNTARFLKIYNQVGNRKDSLRNPPEVDRNPPSDEPQPGPWLAQPPGDAVEAQVNSPGLELIVFSGKFNIGSRAAL